MILLGSGMGPGLMKREKDIGRQRVLRALDEGDQARGAKVRRGQPTHKGSVGSRQRHGHGDTLTWRGDEGHEDTSTWRDEAMRTH